MRKSLPETKGIGASSPTINSTATGESNPPQIHVYIFSWTEHRLFILETELNTGLIPNVAGTPVTLEFRAPIRSQVWELREVD